MVCTATKDLSFTFYQNFIKFEYLRREGMKRVEESILWFIELLVLAIPFSCVEKKWEVKKRPKIGAEENSQPAGDGQLACRISKKQKWSTRGWKNPALPRRCTVATGVGGKAGLIRPSPTMGTGGGFQLPPPPIGQCLDRAGYEI